MINLLPPEGRSAVRSLYRKHLATIMLLCLFCLLVVSLLLMVPSLFLLEGKGGSVGEALRLAQNRPVSREADTLAETVTKENARIDMIAAVPGALSMSETLDRVLSDKLPGISLESIDYSGQKVIAIKGQATTREVLLGFTHALEGDTYFKNVSSPISNLIASTSIEFAITMEPSSEEVPTQ